jgi:hypothetical protein
MSMAYGYDDHDKYTAAVASIAEETVTEIDTAIWYQHVIDSTQWSEWAIDRWNAQLVYFFSPGRTLSYDQTIQSHIDEGDSVSDAVRAAAAGSMKADVLEILRLWADHDDDGQMGYNVPGKGFVPVNS